MNIFFARLSGADGKKQWLKGFGDVAKHQVNGLTCGPDGRVIMTGSIRDAPGYKGTDFGGAIGLLKPQVDDNGVMQADMSVTFYDDFFVAKFDGSGKGIWGHRNGDKADQAGGGVAVDKSGRVAVAGWFQGTVAFGNNLSELSATQSYDSVVLWYDP
jgi:hypothetical protein